jgi:hypothetical protein
MPTNIDPDQQREIDGVGYDFNQNYRMLDRIVSEFLNVLDGASMAHVADLTEKAYRDDPAGAQSSHLLAFHQAVHLSMHCGQIRMIRNLYRTTQGKPILFFPENHTIRSG